MTFIVDGTNGGFFPSWTTGTRPASPAVGQMGYNTTTGNFDAYTASGWTSIITSTVPQGSSAFSSSGPAVWAFANSAQSLTNGASTTIVMTATQYDTAGIFNVGSNKIIPTVPGYYYFTGQIACSGLSNRLIPQITKNSGSGNGNAINGNDVNTATYEATASGFMYANGTTDYFQLTVYSGSANTLNSAGANANFLQAFFIRGA